MSNENDKWSELISIVRPMRNSCYCVDASFNYIERMLEGYNEDFGLDLIPDFQRGHVWTEGQQSHYIENIMRNAISYQGLTIQFNTPDWESRKRRSDLPKTMVCIDGLQRLTAVRRFMAGEIKAFNRLMPEFHGSPFDARRYRLKIAIFDFQTRVDILQHYLDLNVGGTPHKDEEIERVQGLLAAARKAAQRILPNPPLE